MPAWLEILINLIGTMAGFIAIAMYHRSPQRKAAGARPALGPRNRGGRLSPTTGVSRNSCASSKPALNSITSSARSSNEVGTMRPSAWAVFMLITKADSDHIEA